MTGSFGNHHRRSIRLKGYDYSSPGYYFITICIENRLHLFGDVSGEKMVMNDAGKMIFHWWQELNKKFDTVKTGDAIIMPNHFHGIVRITTANNGTPPVSDTEMMGNNAGIPTLADMVDWFKTMTTNAYIRGVRQSGWPKIDGRLWQRNYWEHIIRDNRELYLVRQYIMNNPVNWELDDLNNGRDNSVKNKGNRQKLGQPHRVAPTETSTEMSTKPFWKPMTD